MVFLYLEPIKFLQNCKTQNQLPNPGPLLNDMLPLAEPCLGTNCWRHGDGEVEMAARGPTAGELAAREEGTSQGRQS